MRLQTLVSSRRRQTSVGERWSNPATFGAIPTASDIVVIDAGRTIILDTAAVALNVVIQGTLRVDSTLNVSLTTGNINVGATGRLEVGTAAARYTNVCRFALNGAPIGNRVRYVPTIIQPGETDHIAPGSGNGTLKNLLEGTAQSTATYYTIAFTSASNFGVTNNSGTSLGTGTVGVEFNNMVRFIALAGSNAWDSTSRIRIKNNPRGFANDPASRSLQVQPGGQLYLYGRSMAHVRTTLNAHSTAGASSFTLAHATGWAASDEVVIGPSDYFNEVSVRGYGYSSPSGMSDKRSISSNVGTNLTLDTTVPAARWGLLQYATGAGPSLTNDGFTAANCAAAAAAMGQTAATFAADVNAAITAGLRTVLDERAPVLNLTRNIIIEGVEDTEWLTNGFGAHCMFMGNTSKVEIDGVEFRRAGQAGVNGRYPLHWHMMSYNMPVSMTYPSDGTFTAAPTNNFVKNSSFHNCSHRAIVVHGTWGVTVDNNNVYDVKASAIFLEDQVEQNCFITNNYVLKVRYPVAGKVILDIDAGGQGGPFGFWLPNAQNTIEGNTAGDVFGNGFGNAWLSAAPTGLGRNVAVIPKHVNVLSYRNNTGHSNSGFGLNTNVVQGDELGTYAGVDKWMPTVDGTAAGVRSNRAAVLFRNTSWKNNGGGYLNRVLVPSYQEFLFADNSGQDAQGQAGDGNGPTVEEQAAHFLRHMSFGYSLNHTTFAKVSPTDNDNPRAGVASYTAGIFQEDCVYINYISRTGDGRFHGGVFRTDDLYFYATYPGSHFMLRSKLINSSMGRVTKPAFYGDKTTVLGASLYTQSSAACTAGTTTTLTAASAAWTVNAYQGRNLQYKVATVNYQARIVSNTATVLTLINYADDTSALSVAPVAGQEYEIREASGEHWTMSSVILDPQKMWSQYDRVVQNLPFFTSGLGGVYNADLDRWATNHQLMGVGAASTHNDQDSAGYLPIYPFDVRRLDAGGSELGRYYVPFGSTSINDPRTNRPSDPALTNFRHWSAVSGGKYTMAYPGRTAPASYMHHTITDGWRSTDNFVLRLPFTGATAQGWISSQDDTNGLTSAPTGAVLSDGRAILLVSVATQALVESATVPSFWLDTAGGFVWVKYFGGRTAPAGGFLTGAFNNILKRHFLTIRT